jgi:hypothetical protein
MTLIDLQFQYLVHLLRERVMDRMKREYPIIRATPYDSWMSFSIGGEDPISKGELLLACSPLEGWRVVSFVKFAHYNVRLEVAQEHLVQHQLMLAAIQMVQNELRAAIETMPTQIVWGYVGPGQFGAVVAQADKLRMESDWSMGDAVGFPEGYKVPVARLGQWPKRS